MPESTDYIVETMYNLDNLQQQYPDLKFYPISEKFLSLTVPENAQESLEKFKKAVQGIYRPFIFGLNGTEFLQKSGILSLHNYPLGELRGKNVLIGFVDTGIDYTHPAFRYPDNTTRILRIWDQTIDTGPSPRFDFGTEYTEENINEALSSTDPYLVVPSRDTIGHGTFLAGIAMGYSENVAESFVGTAPAATVAMVKLKPASEFYRNINLILEDFSAYQSNDVMLGVQYLVDLSRQLEMPLVICLGMGNSFGGHDGETVIERYLRSISILENIILVIAAGNEANTGHHFSGNLKTGETQSIELNVEEGENGFACELWASDADKISIAIKSPLGQVISRIPAISYQESSYSFALEKTKITVTYTYPELRSGSEIIVIRMMNPTPGIWTIITYGDFIVEGDYDIWLPVTGFILPNTRFLKPDPFITVCIPGTAIELIVVGAYDYIDGSVYPASGRGPTKRMVIKPDLVAPGSNIGAPKPDGGYTTYVGTSVAAAVTAGACALLLEWAIVNGNLKGMNTRVARIILIRGAERSKGTVYPNPVEGYGKLNLQNSLNLI